MAATAKRKLGPPELSGLLVADSDDSSISCTLKVPGKLTESTIFKHATLQLATLINDSAPGVFFVSNPLQHIFLAAAFAVPQQASDTLIFSVYLAMSDTRLVDPLLNQARRVLQVNRGQPPFGSLGLGGLNDSP